MPLSGMLMNMINFTGRESEKQQIVDCIFSTGFHLQKPIFETITEVGMFSTEVEAS